MLTVNYYTGDIILKKYACVLRLMKFSITFCDERKVSFGEFVLNHEIFSGN
jgi:hypothetical protein